MEYSVENPIIEFSDALDYSVENPIIELPDAFELPFADIADELTSFKQQRIRRWHIKCKKLEEHLGRLCSVAHEEQLGSRYWSSRFSGGLQRLCAYEPVAALQSLKVRLINERRKTRLPGDWIEYFGGRAFCTPRKRVTYATLSLICYQRDFEHASPSATHDASVG